MNHERNEHAEATQADVISEKTLLPLSLVIAVITALILGVVRVEGIGSDTRALASDVTINTAEIKSLKEEDKEIRKDFNQTLVDINTRLARMEGALKIKEE